MAALNDENTKVICQSFKDALYKTLSARAA